MGIVFDSVLRVSLSDDVAQRIRQMIRAGDFRSGDRLPAIAAMARQFGVGGPTVREALKKLETVGLVDIRHGSGVYVGRTADALLITNPIFAERATKKQLVDLIDARIPIEVRTAELAANNATAEHLDDMRQLLADAERSLDDAAHLNQVNLSFHRQIALASGNSVMHQILDVLSSLFREEQRMILDIHGRHRDDHAEHVAIFEALRTRDPAVARQRMQGHLERVREVLTGWEPDAK